MLSPSLIVLPTDVRAAAVGIFAPDGTQLAGFDGSRPANAALSTLAATNASQLLLAANPARRQVFIVNEANKTLFIAFAAAATTAAYTLSIAGNQSLILPLNGYTGVISAILQGGTGNVRVTEVIT